jgi:glycerol-3-phosphate dehydrogenase
MVGYDLLKRGDSLARHRNLSSEEVLEREPLLRREHLSGGFVYYDCVVDDARLTLTSIKTACQRGAAAANYTQATGFKSADRRWREIVFQDRLTGVAGALKARVVVGAGGPWTDELLHLIDYPRPVLRVTKGVHIVLPKERLRVKHAVVMPTRDKRFIFTVPKGNFTYIGTTDTDYEGSLDDVSADGKDLRYLLENANHCFPRARLMPEDIVSAWAGLRPLLREEGDPSKVSRDYHIDNYARGFVIITGGKLTTYRRMAETLVDHVLAQYADRFQADFGPCRTAEAPLIGGEMADFAAYLEAQTLALTGRWKLSAAVAERLVKNYGRNHMDILALGFQNPKLMQAVHPDYPLIKAEVVYAVEEEMAMTLEDFMSRRTDWAFFDRHRGAPLIETVASLMGRLLGWNRRRRLTEIERYRRSVDDMLRFQKR